MRKLLANGDGSIFNLSSIAGIIFRFANDSPLEGDGFELSVPRQKDNVFEASQLDSAIPGEAIAHQMATA
jgi:hypothetical protein